MLIRTSDYRSYEAEALIKQHSRFLCIIAEIIKIISTIHSHEYSILIWLIIAFVSSQYHNGNFRV